MLQPGAEGGKSLLANTVAIDYEASKINQLKMLLNFKKIVLVGEYTSLKSSIIKTIKASTSPSRFYMVMDVACRYFLAEYPIFTADNW